MGRNSGSSVALRGGGARAWWTALLATFVVIAVMAALTLPAGAVAGDPSSTLKVQPTELTGNPNCATSPYPASRGVEYKYEPVSAGDHPRDLGDGVTLTIGISTDKRLASFSIASTKPGVRAVMYDVLVKAGDSSNWFDYDDGVAFSGVSGDTGLHGPVQRVQRGTNVFYEISHISFCWATVVNQPPVANGQIEYITPTRRRR
jgi:hypothetical protein